MVEKEFLDEFHEMLFHNIKRNIEDETFIT